MITLTDAFLCLCLTLIFLDLICLRLSCPKLTKAFRGNSMISFALFCLSAAIETRGLDQVIITTTVIVVGLMLIYVVGIVEG